MNASPVLIVGGSGQLGFELQRCAPKSSAFIAVDLPEFDIGNRQVVDSLVSKLKPCWIFNAAAYTAVDRAESEPEVAFRSNRDGAGYLASAAKEINAGFVQISTDFVFDGFSGQAYMPQSATNPQSVYGVSKLEGENAVLGDHPNAIVIRTSWVYSQHGNNFVKNMIRLLKERPQLTIIADQIGTPTWANGLAKLMWSLALVPENRKYQGQCLHYADAGTASWYDFAVAIQEEAIEAGLLDKVIPIIPIRTDQYPTPAKRPAFSVMNRDSGWSVGGVAPHWRVNLRAMLLELKPKV
jgi:dTDP-4-dehydrorhamnose reductase